MEDALARIHLEDLLDRAGRAHHEGDQAVGEKPLVPDALEYAVQQLVEEEGNAEEHRDVGFLQVLEDLLYHHALAEHCLRSDREGFDEHGEHRVGVVDGQKGVEHVGVVDMEVGLRQEAVRNEVPVSQHDALGNPRRARGEEDGGQVVLGGAARFGDGSGGRLEIVEVRRASLVKRQHLGDLRADRGQLCRLLLVHEEDGGVAGLDQVRRLGQAELVVDGDDDGARLQDRKIGDRPFGGVLAC